MSNDTIAKMQDQMARMQQDMAKMQQTMVDQMKQLQEHAKQDGKAEAETAVTNGVRSEEEDKRLTRAHERVKELGEEMATVFNGLIDEGVIELAAFTLVTHKDGGYSTSWKTTNDIRTGIDEEKLATALDVFTNPRRIGIIKLLHGQTLTGSEISQKSGLVGGQLYHHINILENSGLIQKEGDKYRAEKRALQLLAALSAAVGGMKLAR